jgi:NDP-sugar pyrophosphorylase family protein
MDKHQLELIALNGTGAERSWAHANLALLENGYFTSDELMDIATRQRATLFDPFVPIRRGTTIGKGCSIRRGGCVEGCDVSLGENVVLEGKIRGDSVSLGDRCRVTGVIAVSRIEIGPNNDIDSIDGENSGTIIIGQGNRIDRIVVDNKCGNRIVVGNYNELHRGLQLNAIFPRGDIFIGSSNSLGRDGGGVISTSYRFSRRQVGGILVGSNVETTRGAEVLGFSVLGVEETVLQRLVGFSEENWVKLFTQGTLNELAPALLAVGAQWREIVSTEQLSFANQCVGVRDESKKVSLFGVVKVRRSFLGAGCAVRDGTRVTRSFLREVDIMERGCLIGASKIVPGRFRADVANRTIRGRLSPSQEEDGQTKSGPDDEFPQSDQEYYDDRV